jgi:galactokinase/mevalonate kinase-like predicted kinase
MIESVSALQNRELDERKLGLVGAKRHPDQFVQNVNFKFPLRQEENHTLWAENASVPKTWTLASQHILTGVPDNDWDLHLEARSCLDFVPVGERDWCIRFYGIDDLFQGKISAPRTTLMGRPFQDWCRTRNLQSLNGIPGDTDIQHAPLFPVIAEEDINPRFIEWLTGKSPTENPDFCDAWENARRLAASQLSVEVNLRRLYDQRRRYRGLALTPLLRNGRWSVFYRLDLEHTAEAFAEQQVPLPQSGLEPSDDPLHFIHDAMFRAAVLRKQNMPQWEAQEHGAFNKLRELIVQRAQGSPPRPKLDVIDDQIVWARSPVRLDLAGGWTDTPPYCFEHGGRVLNLAVNLNGQPPIQVFAKKCPRPELVVRSIDLGVEQRIHSFEQLDTFGQAGSEFAVAKAALALSGFLPAFHANAPFGSLKEQLDALGGGIELSMLAAVPKGSGLGTSSILGATLLAALSDLCGLKWDRPTLFKGTLALEQMLTTGGGWQDQAGAVFGGIKLIETSAGLSQTPNVRWLPPSLLGPSRANTTVLLYYTGLTRLAKDILQEVVRGICLNSPARLDILERIAANAGDCFDAVQRCDYHALVRSVSQSWRLNQALDSGTNPPEVQGILDAVAPWIAASKLLGAGGGGFMLMFAKDAAAASRIRQKLTAQPPNPRARFVDFEISEPGLELTRS